MDEDAFLPTENDKLKAQIKEMRRRLAVATIRYKELVKELLEEDLSFMTVSSLTDLIQDPTRVAEYEFDDMTQEIFSKMMATVETCSIREAINYHRLAGRSIYNRTCIRLETFYNKTFKGAYYMLYEKGQYHQPKSIQSMTQSLIQHHTIPYFIHLDAIAKKHLPDNFDTFIRIVHDQVQAYVTKREILQEVDQLKKTHPIEIKYQSESIHKVEIEIRNVHDQTMLVDLYFEDNSSAYPTNVAIYDITNQNRGQVIDNIEHVAMLFKQRPMIDVLINLSEHPQR